MRVVEAWFAVDPLVEPLVHLWLVVVVKMPPSPASGAWALNFRCPQTG